MKFLHGRQKIYVLVLALVGSVCGSSGLSAQATTDKSAFGPGKYCCDMPEVGNVCVVFKADGTYVATGTLSHKDGTSRGTWKHSGVKVILVPKEETGCLVGYLTRFSLDEHEHGVLTWLPKTPQDFGRSGGAIVYPQYKKVNGNLK